MPACLSRIDDWAINFATAGLAVARAARNPTLADGIFDRQVHNAHRIEMPGDSMRKNRGEDERTTP
jgi:hypothetical protein